MQCDVNSEYILTWAPDAFCQDFHCILSYVLLACWFGFWEHSAFWMESDTKSWVHSGSHSDMRSECILSGIPTACCHRFWLRSDIHSECVQSGVVNALGHAVWLQCNDAIWHRLCLQSRMDSASILTWMLSGFIIICIGILSRIPSLATFGPDALWHACFWILSDMELSHAELQTEQWNSPNTNEIVSNLPEIKLYYLWFLQELVLQGQQHVCIAFYSAIKNDKQQQVDACQKFHCQIFSLRDWCVLPWG